jgi:hypothetical protein
MTPDTRYGHLIGSGLYFGDSADEGGVNCNMRIACWAEALDVEKFCDVEPVAPN